MKAFVKCRRCGRAKNLLHACTHCGFQPVKLNAHVLLAAAVIAGVPIAFSILMHARPKQPTLQKAETLQKRDAATDLALSAAVTLKKTLPDPDGLELDSVIVNSSGAVCFRYRSKTSDDHRQAIVSGSKILTQDRVHDFLGSWNELCAGKQGTETVGRINWMAL